MKGGNWKVWHKWEYIGIMGDETKRRIGVKVKENVVDKEDWDMMGGKYLSFFLYCRHRV